MIEFKFAVVASVLLVVPEPYCAEAGLSNSGTLMGADFRIGTDD